MTIGLVALNAFICLIGLLLHFAMKWARYRQDIAKLGPVAYLATVPAQSLVSVLASIGAFAVMAALDWLNPGMAFACGYMGNSIAENLASRFAEPSK